MAASVINLAFALQHFFARRKWMIQLVQHIAVLTFDRHLAALFF
jgi:hypothetical protein